jgi:ABC-type Zn uptake system ZnuABC Zn-binding protein ZnuA
MKIEKSAGATYGVSLNLESLGEGEQGTYAGVMRANVTKIVDALK